MNKSTADFEKQYEIDNWWRWPWPSLSPHRIIRTDRNLIEELEDINPYFRDEKRYCSHCGQEISYA